jgi:hypothetical protein
VHEHVTSVHCNLFASDSLDESYQIVTVQLTTASRMYKPKAVERRDSENRPSGFSPSY